jgi:hypothetical protein
VCLPASSINKGKNRAGLRQVYDPALMAPRRSAGDGLQTELERLFALPPGAFTAARNQLADRLRHEGRRAAAAEVRALSRPTPSSWVVGRLMRLEPKRFQALLAAGRQAREAQRQTLAARGTAASAAALRLRQSLQEARRLIEELRQRGLEMLAAGGGASAAVAERLAANLQALAFVGDAAQAIARGWLGHDLEAPGFELLAGLQAAAGREEASRGAAGRVSLAAPGSPAPRPAPPSPASRPAPPSPAPRPAPPAAAPRAAPASAAPRPAPASAAPRPAPALARRGAAGQAVPLRQVQSREDPGSPPRRASPVPDGRAQSAARLPAGVADRRAAPAAGPAPPPVPPHPRSRRGAEAAKAAADPRLLARLAAAERAAAEAAAESAAAAEHLRTAERTLTAARRAAEQAEHDLAVARRRAEQADRALGLAGERLDALRAAVED